MKAPVTIRPAVRDDLPGLEWDGQYTHFRRLYAQAFRACPHFRGAGIGTQLMQTAEANLGKCGYRRTKLNVARDTPHARRLYERFGYRVVAAEPGK